MGRQLGHYPASSNWKFKNFIKVCLIIIFDIYETAKYKFLFPCEITTVEIFFLIFIKIMALTFKILSWQIIVMVHEV